MSPDDPDALARLVHETRHKARAGLDRPFIPEPWEERPEALRDVDRAIAAAVAAAEGERIAQMADRNEAVCRADDGTSCYFSALIRGGAHDG